MVGTKKELIAQRIDGFDEEGVHVRVGGVVHKRRIDAVATHHSYEYSAILGHGFQIKLKVVFCPAIIRGIERQSGRLRDDFGIGLIRGIVRSIQVAEFGIAFLQESIIPAVLATEAHCFGIIIRAASPEMKSHGLIIELRECDRSSPRDTVAGQQRDI